jgi:phospholipase/carboxylesterase
MSILSGPNLAPVRGPATHLVVLAHGYGADGNDLIGLAPHWQRLLPTVAFVAPNAPERCEGSPMGYQWFPISRLDPHEMRKGVESVAPIFDAFLDAELARLNLPPERLALVGFSQGTMLSLHVALRRKVKPAAIIGYSGLLAGEPPSLGPGTPPILLVHGDSDPMIPPEALFFSAGALGAAGGAVQWHLSPGIGHGIGPDGLYLGGMFLALALSSHLKRENDEICCRFG